MSNLLKLLINNVMAPSLTHTILSHLFFCCFLEYFVCPGCTT